MHKTTHAQREDTKGAFVVQSAWIGLKFPEAHCLWKEEMV